MHPYAYPKAEGFDDLRDAQGYHVLRLALRSEADLGSALTTRSLVLEGPGSVAKTRFHTFDTTAGGGAEAEPELQEWSPRQRRLQVAVVWIEGATPETAVRWVLPGSDLEVGLAEVSRKQEVAVESGQHRMRANFLRDLEVGAVDPGAVGIRPVGESFSLIAMADTQGGNHEGHDGLMTRMQIHNAFIRETVRLVNSLKLDPSFAVVIGDITDGWGTGIDFLQMNSYLRELRCPLLYTIGNHETRLRSVYGPGYEMSEFGNFLAAQKAINGLTRLLYSINLGRWHFVFWPDPLRRGFWETHPHYFEWLERDLEAHRDRPTIIFQHVPVHPIGIDPMVSYCEPPGVKRTFLEIAARHGNVRMILSGHVHIPVRASLKTAVSYRGMHLINLPAAGYRPRAFGEPDLTGGPSQGAAILEFAGEQVELTFKTLTEEEFPYPKQFREFDPDANALWLTPKCELAAESQFINGDFREGLKGWARFWVYEEDEDPSNRCEVRSGVHPRSPHSLFVFNRRRGFEAPGQDRLPQSINQISQAVAVLPGQSPEVRFECRIDGTVSSLHDLCGGYVWLEGFSGHTKRFNLVYAAGVLNVNFADQHSDLTWCRPLMMRLPLIPDRWSAIRLDLASDVAAHLGDNPGWGDLAVDRLVLTLGVWTVNQGSLAPFGLDFTGFQVGLTDGAGSWADGRRIEPIPDGDPGIWWRGKETPNRNLAGEHRYHLPMKVRFTE